MAAVVAAGGSDSLGDFDAIDALRDFVSSSGQELPEGKTILKKLEWFDARGGMSMAIPCTGDADAEAATEEDDVAVDIVPKGYVISVVGRRKSRCLHHMALCRRGRAMTTAFEDYGENLPDASLYDRICKMCWKSGDLSMEQGAATSSSSSSSSSSES